jgi:hypothetical protein
VVERASCLLCIDKIHGKFTRICDSFLDCPFCNFGKFNPVKLCFVSQFFAFQNLVDVPGNGFPFTIEVSCEINRLGAACGFNNFINMLFAALTEFIVHGKIIFSVNRTVPRGQVTNMSVGSQHLEIITEVSVDGFRLGWRFYD